MAGVKEFNWDYDDPLKRIMYFDPYRQKEQLEGLRANNVLRTWAYLGALRPSQQEFYRVRMADLEARAGGKFRRPFTRSTMTGWSANFRWIDRVRRFDELELERQLELLKARADQNHEKRITMLEAWSGKVVLAMSQSDPTQANWADITAALKMIVQELRVEYSAGQLEARKRRRGRPAKGDDTLINIFEHLTDQEVEDALANIEAATGDNTMKGNDNE